MMITTMIMKKHHEMKPWKIHFLFWKVTDAISIVIPSIPGKAHKKRLKNRGCIANGLIQRRVKKTAKTNKELFIKLIFIRNPLYICLKRKGKVSLSYVSWENFIPQKMPSAVTERQSPATATRQWLFLGQVI